MPNGPLKITTPSFDVAEIKSDNKLTDETLLKLLATSVNKKKKKGNKKKKATGGATTAVGGAAAGADAEEDGEDGDD